ncbi:MAG: hypothetical protein K2Q25_05800, partial [Mycobacteriaceae bacterium]|nr:hypothetical protein [Mycobacteriaceae bacterium]
MLPLHPRERVVLHVDSRRARWVGGLVVLGVGLWFMMVLGHGHLLVYWQAVGPASWSVAIVIAVAGVARGIFLGRPVTVSHALVAAVLMLGGIGAHLVSHHVV